MCSVIPRLLSFVISWKLVLHAGEPARDNVDLGVAEAFGEARIELGNTSLGARQRLAPGGRQPQPRGTAVVGIGPLVDQPRLHHPLRQPADAGRPEIERSTRLADQGAVALAQHEQQAALRRGYATVLGLRRHETLQPPLRDIEQVDQAPVRPGAGMVGARVISHAKYLETLPANVKSAIEQDQGRLPPEGIALPYQIKWRPIMRAHQIMTRDVLTVRPNATIEEAAKLMLRHHISGLP